MLVVLLLILTIANNDKVRRLDRQYDYFMREKMQKLWKMSFLDQIEEIRDLKGPKTGQIRIPSEH